MRIYTLKYIKSPLNYTGGKYRVDYLVGNLMAVLYKMVKRGGKNMGFWTSVNRKARKEHKCAYCEKVIQVGDRYSRETGKYDGEFNNYCLCLRCKWLIDKFEVEYLEDICFTLSENDLINCPSCGTYDVKYLVISEDKQELNCKCEECGEEWVADLTINGIKESISTQKP